MIVISVLAAYGMAIALVEKRKDWPIRRWNILLRWLLHKYVHRKAHRLLKCTVCTSFWTTLVTDTVLCLIFHSYFMWPLSGFITVGLAWTVINLMNAIDPPHKAPVQMQLISSPVKK